MQFQEAKDRLKKLADGKYHSIQYELTEYVSGKQKTSCWMYIQQEEGDVNVTGTRFQECLDVLSGKLKAIEDIPNIDG
jgi:hypothetical protein